MSLRINKLLSEAGLGSRRDVEKYITEGRVMLNDEKAELSDIVVEGDVVTFDDEELPVDDLIREAIAMQKYLAEAEEDYQRKQSRKFNSEYAEEGWAVNKKSKAFRTGNKVRTMRKNEDWGEETMGRSQASLVSSSHKKKSAPRSHSGGGGGRFSKTSSQGKTSFSKK